MSILKPGSRRSPSHAIHVLIPLALAAVLLGSVGSAQASVTHTLLSEIGTGAGAPSWSTSSPTGVAVDNDNDPLSPSYGEVYVTDYASANKVIDKFKEELGTWKYKCEITGAGPTATKSSSTSECPTLVAGPGAFTGIPYEPAVNPSSGEMYLAEYTGNVVDEFSPGGEYLGHITGSEEPRSVAIGPSGEVYIDSYENGIIFKYEPATAKLTECVKELGATNAFGVAVDDDSLSPSYGDVYVANNKTKEVEKYSSACVKLGTITHSFGSVYEVAVAPSTGDLYVADYTDAAVDEFNSEGKYLTIIKGAVGGEKTKAGSLYPYGVAVDNAGDVYVADYKNKVIDVFSADVVVPAPATGAASGIGSKSVTLNGTINPEEGEVTSCSFEYGTSTSPYGHSVPCKVKPGKTIGEEIGKGDSPVAVSAEVPSGLEPNTKYNFQLVAGGSSGGTAQGANETFTTLSVPVIESASSTNVTDTTARLHATINPEGSQTSYHFEYDTREYKTGEGPHGTSVPTPEGAVGAGTSGIAETVELEKLLGETTYYYRVVATNARSETTYSAGYSFATVTELPIVSQTLASPVASTNAILTAYITPDYSQTTYHFEYGTTESFGSYAPAFNRDIGSGSEPVLAQEPISELSPDATYYFRVVATNSAGTTYGPTRTFTTLPAEGTCPNEQVREESDINALHTNANGETEPVPFSTQLPECRAYEQVTPQDKDGARIEVHPFSFGTSGPAALATSGLQLVVESASLWGVPGGDPVEAFVSANYLLQRGQEGWTFSSLTPVTAEFPYAQVEYKQSEELGEELWDAIIPTDPQNSGSIYRRAVNGQFAEVGPIAPSSATTGNPPQNFSYIAPSAIQLSKVVGASNDLTDVLFQVFANEEAAFNGLWPGDETERSSGALGSLYEYAGTDQQSPTLVGVTNANVQIGQCGSGLGGDTTQGGGAAAAGRNAVSAGGSTVFFNAIKGGCTGHNGKGAGTGTGPAANQIYARIGQPGAAQTTVNVAAAEQPECETSASCGVSGAVAYQGAASDGSKVFFTTAAPLLTSDKDATTDIYECELPGDEGATPAPHGVVDACPDLKAITATGTSEGANVQSVVAVNEEGTRVYFVATGALAGTRNEQHEQPQAGKDNLYLWEAASGGSGGSVTFITTLPTASLAESEATPDGQYLAFTSTVDLTPGDTSKTTQVFRYSAASRELVRVSVGQDGFNDNGNTTTDPATLASSAGENGRLSISDDGAYVAFQSSDALTPEVDGGVNNSYLWHEGNVMLISEGRDTNTKDGLVGISANGENVFFVTASQLVSQDTDEQTDIYDARIDGGFPAPTEAKCEGEECQGALSGPLGQIIPGSSGAASIGNLVSPGLKPPGVTPKTTPKPKAKVKTRAEKLKAALKGCRKDKSKSGRKVCEAKARKRYGPVKKSMGKAKRKKK